MNDDKQQLISPLPTQTPT